jgi:hypothetical protein
MQRSISPIFIVNLFINKQYKYKTLLKADFTFISRQNTFSNQKKKIKKIKNYHTKHRIYNNLSHFLFARNSFPLSNSFFFQNVLLIRKYQRHPKLILMNHDGRPQMILMDNHRQPPMQKGPTPRAPSFALSSLIPASQISPCYFILFFCPDLLL